MIAILDGEAPLGTKPLSCESTVAMDAASRIAVCSAKVCNRLPVLVLRRPRSARSSSGAASRVIRDIQSTCDKVRFATHNMMIRVSTDFVALNDTIVH